MTEDDNKNAAAAEEQPENTESMEASKSPDTNSETGTDLAEPAGAPADGEGCESVTIVIIARDEKRGELMVRSVMKNLVGVDADVHLVTGENIKDTDIETLAEHLKHVDTERIILMTEGMFILNPSTIYDIGTRKEPSVNMPALMHKSVLEPLLKELKADLPYADIADAYARQTPEVTPIPLGDWRKDPWLLPIVSKNPSREALEVYGAFKKFMHVGQESWSDDLVKFLEERFPADK